MNTDDKFCIQIMSQSVSFKESTSLSSSFRLLQGHHKVQAILLLSASPPRRAQLRKDQRPVRQHPPQQNQSDNYLFLKGQSKLKPMLWKTNSSVRPGLGLHLPQGESDGDQQLLAMTHGHSRPINTPVCFRTFNACSFPGDWIWRDN